MSYMDRYQAQGTLSVGNRAYYLRKYGYDYKVVQGVVTRVTKTLVVVAVGVDTEKTFRINSRGVYVCKEKYDDAVELITEEVATESIKYEMRTQALKDARYAVTVATGKLNNKWMTSEQILEAVEALKEAAAVIASYNE